MKLWYHEEKATLPVESLPYIAAQMSMIRTRRVSFAQSV
jgi:hypothetical protein